MNKRGFTLVELLAVVTVLGLLLTIVIPNILNIIETSKKNSFLGEAQAVYRTAKIKALDLTSSGVIDSKGNIKLDINGNKLDYCVIVDEMGAITNITVSNGMYIIWGESNFMSLDVSSVTSGNMDSFVCE